MEDEKESEFEVIITKPAEINFYSVLEYFYEHYSFERAEEISDELRDKVKELHFSPEKGSIELSLKERNNKYRFILFRRTKIKDIKIIYFVDISSKKVFVTDFFPCEMDYQKIPKRN
jgi:mRNA-degrading endonuclease RelE of RelBE toxin-antitoxin system